MANEGDNQLARGEMEVGGQHLSLQDVKSDAYVVGAMNDHIVPWQASYKATRLLGGNVRYVLFQRRARRRHRQPARTEGPARGGRQEPAHRRRVARAGGEPQRFLVGGTGPDGPGSGPVP